MQRWSECELASSAFPALHCVVQRQAHLQRTVLSKLISSNATVEWWYMNQQLGHSGQTSLLPAGTGSPSVHTSQPLGKRSLKPDNLCACMHSLLWYTFSVVHGAWRVMHLDKLLDLQYHWKKESQGGWSRIQILVIVLYFLSFSCESSSQQGLLMMSISHLASNFLRDLNHLGDLGGLGSIHGLQGLGSVGVWKLCQHKMWAENLVSNRWIYVCA